MNLKGELNYIRGVMANLDTKEGQYHALKCVEAVVCRLYGKMERAESLIKDLNTICKHFGLDPIGDLEHTKEYIDEPCNPWSEKARKCQTSD
jgi:hypothetical protein